MAGVTTCPRCRILYETSSEELACSPDRADRLCPVCYRVEHPECPTALPATWDKHAAKILRDGRLVFLADAYGEARE